MRKRIYISGPMTGMPGHNFPAFNAAARRLRSIGWRVVNPAENFGGRTDLPRELYMRADVMLLAMCDAIALLPGWQYSRGARVEYLLAYEMGLDVLDAMTLLPAADAPQVVVQIARADESIDESVLSEALRITDGARQSSYGHPREDFARTALMWTGILRGKLRERSREVIRINSACIFSADIFSQNEVENIADSPQSQLELIDKLAAGQIADINRQIATVRSKLEANGNAILANRQQLDGLADEVGTLSVVESKIKALAQAQGDQKTDEVNVAHQQRALRGREEQAVKESRDLIQKYAQWLREATGQFAQESNAAFDESMLAGPNGKCMAGIRDVSRRIGDDLDGLFERATATLESGAEEVGELVGTLQHAHQQQELAFRDLIAKHNQARGVATERAELEKKRNDLLAKARRKAEIQKQLDKLSRERSGLASQLRKLWADRYELRRQVADWINQGAKSPIRVQIDQCGDRSAYQQALATWMKGHVGQYNPAAKKIADYVPPSDLLRIVAEGRSGDLQTQAELGDAQTAKAMEALGKLEVRLQLDTMELADLPRIELQDGDEWKNSLQLSTGQKCTTILPILLLESDNPLLIDQPEDNLDNRYIYDTVVNAIHRVKQRRQIILITHNPNIPVLGDAAAVYVLTSDGERSRVSNRGSVDDCKMEIINLLEGGKEAFVRRKERYQY